MKIIWIECGSHHNMIHEIYMNKISTY